MATIQKKQTPKGTMYWEVRVRRRGAPAMSKSFKTEREAKAWANKQEHAIDEGKRVSRAAEKFTIAEAIDAYIQEVDTAVPRLATADKKIGDLRSVRNDLGKFSVAGLSREDVKNYLKQLAQTQIPPPATKKKTHPLYNGDKPKFYSPATIRKFYYALKQALQWHSRAKRYYLDPELFVDQAVPSGWSGQRDRRLKPGEEERLYASIDKGRTKKEEWKRLIRFALETAMRDQEMLKARWTDLDLGNRTLTIPKEHSKTRDKRHVPLSSKAVEILETQRALCPKREQRIFHSWANAACVSHGFRRIALRVNLENLKFHDLRHEATSRLFEKGKLGTMEIMKITGHKELSTIERYTHLHPNELAKKLD